MDILYHLWDFSFLGLFYKQENIGSKDERSAIWPTEICYFLKKEREIGQISVMFYLESLLKGTSGCKEEEVLDPPYLSLAFGNTFSSHSRSSSMSSLWLARRFTVNIHSPASLLFPWAGNVDWEVTVRHQDSCSYGTSSSLLETVNQQ